MNEILEKLATSAVVPVVVLDDAKAHDSLEEIIASAWNWHKNHPNGYDE